MKTYVYQQLPYLPWFQILFITFFPKKSEKDLLIDFIRRMGKEVKVQKNKEKHNRQEKKTDTTFIHHPATN